MKYYVMIFICLALTSWVGSHNASIGNKPFKEKLETYNQNPLSNQQAEIKDFALQEDNQFVWKVEKRINRHLAKLFGSGALAPPKGMRLKPHFLVLQEL